MYQSMVAAQNDVIGNVTAALKASGIWENAIALFTSDNGEPSYNAAHTANNYPLRGSKLSDWEGGVRVSAFVAGGWVPQAQAGTKRHGLIGIADWLGTFAELAGVVVNDTLAAKAAAAGHHNDGELFARRREGVAADRGAGGLQRLPSRLPVASDCSRAGA